MERCVSRLHVVVRQNEIVHNFDNAQVKMQLTEKWEIEERGRKGWRH